MYPKVPLIVLTSIYALSSNDADIATSSIPWDTDSVSVVVDNSANTHIWNDLDNFVAGSLCYYDDSDDVGILTIGEDSSWPLGIGRVIISITDNLNQDVALHLNNCLYFPASPVKIISVTSLAKQSNDFEETWIKMRLDRSTLSWDSGKHVIDFCHASSSLPVLQVNTGTSQLASFCSLFEHHKASAANFDEASAMTTSNLILPMDGYNDVCFATEDISSSLSPADTRDILLSSTFAVGDQVQYVTNGINEPVDIVKMDYEEDSTTTCLWYR